MAFRRKYAETIPYEAVTAKLRSPALRLPTVLLLLCLAPFVVAHARGCHQAGGPRKWSATR